MGESKLLLSFNKEKGMGIFKQNVKTDALDL